MTKTPVRLSDLFRYYRHGTPHQMAAIVELEAALLKVAPDLLNKEEAWFKTWSQAGKQDDYGPAVKLIKDFEGLRLEAYADPLHGWAVPTIGYGSTHGVKRGDRITQSQADAMLAAEVERVSDKLAHSVPAWKEMSPKQRGALLSFSFNLGPNWYAAKGFETLSKRIREKDWKAVPAALELYRNPGTSAEAGLLRRRKAEGALWAQGLVKQAVQQESPYKVKPSDPFGTRLSPNITLGEFALGQPARRFTAQHQVDTAAELAAFLERVRRAFGDKRVSITSGYRPPAINKMVHGAISSEHLYNAPGVGAVDFYLDGADIKAVQSWCDKYWPYSVGYGADRGFVHLGSRIGKPRVRWEY